MTYDIVYVYIYTYMSYQMGWPNYPPLLVYSGRLVWVLALPHPHATSTIAISPHSLAVHIPPISPVGHVTY